MVSKKKKHFSSCLQLYSPQSPQVCSKWTWESEGPLPVASPCLGPLLLSGAASWTLAPYVGFHQVPTFPLLPRIRCHQEVSFRPGYLCLMLDLEGSGAFGRAFVKCWTCGLCPFRAAFGAASLVGVCVCAWLDSTRVSRLCAPPFVNTHTHTCTHTFTHTHTHTHGTHSCCTYIGTLLYDIRRGMVSNKTVCATLTLNSAATPFCFAIPTFPTTLRLVISVSIHFQPPS